MVKESSGSTKYNNSQNHSRNNQEAKKWYIESSKYLTTYYGQLAHLKISPNKAGILNNL